MKAKRFILSALAGVMVLGGSIAAYANQNDSQTSFEVQKIKFELSEEEKAELEKMKQMTSEQLQEYIKENKPRVVPAIKVAKGKAYNLSEEEKAELEKMKEMTEQELIEYIKENKPRVIPGIKATQDVKKVMSDIINDKAQEDKIETQDM